MCCGNNNSSSNILDKKEAYRHDYDENENLFDLVW